MKKKVLLVLASALLLASCGGGEQPAATTQEARTTQEAQTTQTTQEATTSTPATTSSAAESKASYLITFKDEEGNTLDSKKWEEGQTPSYDYKKEDTQEWDYTFEGWSLSLGGAVITIPAVSAEATYYAVVSKVKQRYTITFNSQGGSDVAAITEDYGASIAKPTDPTYEGHKFVAWSYDKDGEQAVTWPLTLTKNETLYANWNETVDIKGYLATLKNAVNQSPYGYIPEKMRPANSRNHVTDAQVTYDFNSFVNVSDIRYGGFGEQWNMVIDNVTQSELFYSVLTAAETVINSSVIAFNNYLDSNPGDTATHTLDETSYTAKLDYRQGLLVYVLQYKTGWTIPLFGEILPQIDMKYDVTNGERSVRIQLTENNAMRYVVKENSYAFGLEYGISTVSRKAYFQIDKLENDDVQGHIYEYVQYKDKDLVASCADFYIGSEYTSVVGNKASGMPGFTGYINELYKTEEGKLLGYKVRESFTKWGVTATYHTLWFNLSDITGINNIKAIKNDSTTFGLGGQNNHDIYLNNSATIFEPTYNTKLAVKTSRKYDVEMRKQFFFGYQEDTLTEYQVDVPMMFIQDNHDNYTNFDDFPTDIASKSGINASVAMPATVLGKIRADYETLIDVFIANKDLVTGATIEAYIGNAIVIE